MIKKIFSRMKPTTLSRALELAARGKSQKTKRWYADGISALIEDIGDVPIHTLTPDQLTDWYHSLPKRDRKRGRGKISPYTVDTYARAVRSVLNTMVEIDKLERSPFQVKLAKLPRTAKKAIREADLDSMIRYAEADARNHALLLIARDTGARAGEILSMTCSRTHINRYYLDAGQRVFIQPGDEPPVGAQVIYAGKSFVHGKGNQYRPVFFGHAACVALRRYLRSRSHLPFDELWLSSKDRPLSRDGFYHIFRTIGKKLGIEKFNPHSFRHALARRLMANGANLKAVQEILGHKDIGVTADIYGRFSEDEIWKMHMDNVHFDDPEP